MEKINNRPTDAAPVVDKLDDIPRCPNCTLICSPKLNYKEGNSMIDYECENNHKGNILLKDYMVNYNKFALSKEKCGICGKNQKEVKGDFSYCTKCKQFLCQIHMIVIVLNVKRIYVFIVKQNMNIII